MPSAAEPAHAAPPQPEGATVDDWFRWSSPAGLAMILVDIAACVLLLRYVPSL
jgi:hypothetical protein